MSMDLHGVSLMLHGFGCDKRALPGQEQRCLLNIWHVAGASDSGGRFVLWPPAHDSSPYVVISCPILPGHFMPNPIPAAAAEGS